MTVSRELRLAVDVYRRDADELAILAAACSDAPKGYVVQGLMVDCPPGIRPHDHKRGAYVCTVTAVMVPYEMVRETGDVGSVVVDAGTEETTEGRPEGADLEEHADQIVDSMDDEVIRSAACVYATALYRREMGMCGIDEIKAADDRLRDIITRRVHGTSDNAASDHRRRAVPLTPVGVHRAQDAARTKEGMARAERAARRESHISQIRETLQHQDDASAPMGVRPFPDSHAFAAHLGDMAAIINGLKKTPDRSTVTQYRDIVKALGANCVHELDRLSTDPAYV